jgi:hypothetical protein
MSFSTSFPDRRTGRFVLVTLLLFLVSLLPAGPVAAQPAADDRLDSAISTAIELSRMRESGEIFEIYDRMLPDARDAFPRQAFLNWVEAGGLPIPVDDPVIDGAVIADWTWDVTGEVFEDAAIVSYTQSVSRNGVAVEEAGDWIFINHGERWRWIPGLLAPEIAGLVDDLESEPSTYEPTFRQAAYVRIDRFWQNIFLQTGLEYESMDDIVGVTEEPYATGCGLEEDISQYAIYYCTLDETVYYDPDFRDQVVVATGTYGFTTIIAHEWGHHIQTLLGVDVTLDPEVREGLYPIELELQADCLAGIYAQDAIALDLIDRDDITSAISITGLSGDAPGTAWNDVDAHGNAAQRVQSFLTGYEDGFEGCNIDLDDY